MWKHILFVVFILFCIELGLFLMLLPWSQLWERNVLLVLVPGSRAWLLNSYFRGAISGLGLVNLWVGVSDAWNFRRAVALLEKPASEKSESNSPGAGPHALNAETTRARGR